MSAIDPSLHVCKQASKHFDVVVADKSPYSSYYWLDVNLRVLINVNIMSSIDSAAEDIGILEMDLDLEEDVAAELEEFVLLGRLGLKDEAWNLADTVLRRHLHFFPVFAEIAGLCCETNRQDRAANLICQLTAEDITFRDADERSFTRAVALFGMNRLTDSTRRGLGIEQLNRQEIDEQLAQAEVRLFRSTNMHSPVQVRIRQKDVYRELTPDRSTTSSSIYKT